MDYHHTEDFARRMEAAALRGHMLRDAAIDAFFAAIGRGLRAFAHRLARCRNWLPEA